LKCQGVIVEGSGKTRIGFRCVARNRPTYRLGNEKKKGKKNKGKKESRRENDNWEEQGEHGIRGKGMTDPAAVLDRRLVSCGSKTGRKR